MCDFDKLRNGDFDKLSHRSREAELVEAATIKHERIFVHITMR